MTQSGDADLCGYVLKNPAVLAQRAKIKAEKPAILTVAEARALVQSVADDFVAAVALELFAGLRPESEVWALDWSQIDFKEKTVDVSESKNLAGERFVKMSENLIESLLPRAQKSGPVSASGDAYYIGCKSRGIRPHRSYANKMSRVRTLKAGAKIR